MSQIVELFYRPHFSGPVLWECVEIRQNQYESSVVIRVAYWATSEDTLEWLGRKRYFVHPPLSVAIKL